MPLARSGCQVSEQPEPSTTEPDTEVESMTMAKNVLPFRKPVPVAAQSTAREHGRVIFQIRGSRFALNFHVTVTEVNPVDAEILSIDKGLLGPQRARRKVSSTQFERRSFPSEKSW